MTASWIAEHGYYRGRVALCAILKAMGIGRGDDVALQAFTCLAVPEGVMAAGATPIYVDIEPQGYNMSAEDLATKLTPRTKAVVVQHTFGIPARLDAIRRIADERGLPVIEDCCHTLASTYRGQRVGTLGAAAFHSFEWGKPIVAGLGGSALLNEEDLRRRVAADYGRYRRPGLTRRLKIELQYQAFNILYRPWLYWPVRSLFHVLARLNVAEGNYHPVGANEETSDEFSLCMAPRARKRLLAKLKHVEAHAQHARWLARQYASLIRSPSLVLPTPPPESEVVYARFPLRAVEKERLLARARRANIELAAWYRTPIHPLSPGEAVQVHYEAGSCPHAEQRGGEVVSLPTHRRTGMRYVRRVVDLLNCF